MKVLLINGSPKPDGCTFTALSEVARILEQEGIATEIFQVGKLPIRGCTDCGGCSKPGMDRCIFDNDPVNRALEKVREADGLVVGSPVHYAGASGMLTSLLDRMFFAGDCFANKPAAAVVSCRRGGATAAFDQLIKYFTISRMPVVSSQYWNMVHGFTPDQVRQDLEGMQTMRTLARNMAWLLKSIQAGKDAGLPLPEIEPQIMTNFIR